MYNAFSTVKAGCADFVRFIRDSLFLHRRAAILMYHSIGNAPMFFVVHEKEFTWQMAYLYQKQYRVISLIELIHLIATGEKIPRKTVILSFDDGYEDTYSAVFPILKRYGFPATIFVTTGWVGDKNLAIGRDGIRFPMLDTRQIHEMYSSGLISFAPHTSTHPRLSRSAPDGARREILGSKVALEKIISGASVFAYPYGDYDAYSLGIVREVFDAAVTVRQGLVSSGDSLWELPRQSVDSLVTRIRFRLKLPI